MAENEIKSKEAIEAKEPVEISQENEPKNQIVKSDSKAYGYNYASLADIAKQGFTIPKMCLRLVDGETFVFWYDADLKEWLQGAPLIVPEMKGMNAAQAMGSALTYARRYTAQMALSLACDDDSKLEKTENGAKPTGKVYGNNNGGRKVDFRAVREKLAQIDNQDELISYWKKLNLTDGQKRILKDDFGKRKEEIGGQDGVE